MEKISPRVEIFNKDALEFLREQKDASIDLVITDPPYVRAQESW